MSDSHTMQCLEVWGDNRATQSGVAMPGLDAWVHSRPAGSESAGGDVHYVSSCATGRVIRMLVADVSGHGEEVASVAGRLRGLMRRYMNHIDQRRLLGDLNREFLGLNRVGQFATALVITCWTPTGELTISSAGHPCPIRFSAETGTWQPLFEPGAHANLPLGVEERTEFEQVRVKLDPGDRLLAFTDGIVETKSPAGNMLSNRGLVEMLQGLPDNDPESVVTTLIDRVGEYRDGAAADDDVTVLLAAPNDTRPSNSIATNVVGGLRVAKEMFRAIGAPRTSAVPELNPFKLIGEASERNGRA